MVTANGGNEMFNENLLLTNEAGKRLYNEYAKDMPIVDYHCHLIPQEIYENKRFQCIGEMWLAHDHYKWRAMRTFGIDEKYITGEASYFEKYMAFAGILPLLIGNPIYIWCALELKRFFNIDVPLNGTNAEEIYHKTKRIIDEQNITPRKCMEMANVELVCTTEDPTDTLEYHAKMRTDSSIKTNIISAFRPDKAFYCEKAEFAGYIKQLTDSAGIAIDNFGDVIAALEKRLLHFKSLGSMLSDHGIEEFDWCDYTPSQIEAIFMKAISGQELSEQEIAMYRSAFLVLVGELYYRHGFVMQLHIGTYQGANQLGERTIGRATGFDCADDSTGVKSIGKLLNVLREKGTLPKTILYPLDGSKIETWAILAAGFCGENTKAKVQLGAPWWFNDQVYGINRQFEAIANLYPASLSIGMLTDSRSFLSYPRHELYRRCLCNYFGKLVERGEYFSDEKYLKKMIQDVCYFNAIEYLK